MLDPYDLSPVSVIGLADVNGDGFDDVLVASPSVTPGDPQAAGVYVVLGREDGFPASIDLSSLEGSGNGL